MRKLANKALLIAAVLLSANQLPAEKAKKSDVEIGASLLSKIKPALVKVRYYLKYHDNKCPDVAGYWCGNCGSYHTTSAEDYIEQNRPLEAPGYMVSDSAVLTPDLVLQNRFIKKIEVVQEDKVVSAKISCFYKDEKALEITLDKPLTTAKPLNFTENPDERLFNVAFSDEGGFWKTSIVPFALSGMIYSYENDKQYYMCRGSSMIVDKNCNAVAFTSYPRVSTVDGWKISPNKWEKYNKPEMDKMLDQSSTILNDGIVLVKMNFRPPTKSNNRDDFGYDDDEIVGTELLCLGLLIDNGKLIVLTNMKRSVIARLEQISILPKSGRPVKAEFSCVLKKLGILIANCKDSDALNSIKLSSDEVELNSIISLIEAGTSGKSVYGHPSYTRVDKFDLGMNGYRVPVVDSYTEQTKFLFNDKQQLTAFSVSVKKVQDQWGDDGFLLQSAYLKRVLDNLDSYIDKSCVPMAKGDEKIGFLGVEVQALTKELALLNNIADLTEDGTNGAIVNHVYKGSVADNLGMQLGDIIIGISTGEGNKPLRIELHDNNHSNFPWERLGEIPEQYFGEVPAPWGFLNSGVNKLLTKIGVGNKVLITYYRSGKKIENELTIKTAPTSFETTKKFKSKELGIDVKDFTFETRRYFKVSDKTPGVIIEMIDAGSKAATSGLKPFEFITHVNGKEVNVELFKELTTGQKELQLTVKRMSKSRIVKIEL